MLHGSGANLHRVLNWDDLRYFLAVARARTLAQAARDLKVEHTTVGRRLKALEVALGAQLFTRGPDGYMLSPAGEAILPLVSNIGDQVDSVERNASGRDSRAEGLVRLTTSESFSEYFVRQLAKLKERHPDLIVEILSGNRAFDLMRGEADLAFRIRPDSSPDLIVRKVARFSWALYASFEFLARKGVADFDDLSAWDVIGYDSSLAAVPGALWLAEHATGAHVVMRANSIIAAKNATLAGMGIGALPCFLAEDEPTLSRISQASIGARDGFLVVHPDLAKVARVRAVMDFIIETISLDARRWEGEAPAERVQKLST